MFVANPFLDFAEFRRSDTSRYPHGGSTVRLGIASNHTFAGILSSVEVNFSETANGRSARGAAAMNRFYVAKQQLVEEKQWHRSAGRWVLHATRSNLPDDPDSALVTYRSSPAVVSFLDSPGVPINYLASLAANVDRVAGLQNFRLWVNVSPAHSQGTFQAASDFTWHHYLCLQRRQTGWEVNRAASRLGQGELRLAAPLWQ